jgi:hypothetical protein
VKISAIVFRRPRSVEYDIDHPARLTWPSKEDNVVR